MEEMRNVGDHWRLWECRGPREAMKSVKDSGRHGEYKGSRKLRECRCTPWEIQGNCERQQDMKRIMGGCWEYRVSQKA